MPVFAQTGPGLGNLNYNQNQVFEPIGFIESPQGHGNVTMVQGYLMAIYSSDGGGNDSNGGIEFWNVADPANPSLFVRHESMDTFGLREAHGFSLAWYGDRLLLAAQAVLGIQIWDVTDPQNILLLSYLDLPGIDRGDYSGGWWLFWQAPYIYLAGVDSGLYVVDARVPTSPVPLAQVPTGDLGGVSPSQVFAVGNLAVVMESQGSGFASIDISIPDQPRLIQTFTGRAGYSHLFAGDGKILTSGNIPPRAHFFQVNHDGGMSYLDTAGFFFNSGGYGSYQDGIFHSGFSNNYQKFSISPPDVLGSGSSGRTDRDEDFSTVLGNLVFVGDDHGVGTALIPHQSAPDNSPPVVEWMHPPSGATGVALSTRVGLSFSDHIDPSSMSSATLRIEDSTGAEVPSIRSAQMGLINLAPIAALPLNSSFTVIAEGLLDVAGNPAPRFEGTFTTGDGSIAQSPTAAVTGVDVNIALGDYALGIFEEGKLVYSDRDFVFTAQYPARYDRQAYIQTANNDKINFLTNFLSFDLLAPAEVIVLYDARASDTPNWMSGFTPTGESVVTTDTTLNAYSQTFPVGSVQLGGNSGLGSSGADSMYSVVIIPEPVPCEIDLSPVETGTITLSAMGPAAGGYEWRVDGRTFSGAAPSVGLSPGRYSVLLTVTDGPLSATCGGVKIVHQPLVSVPARVAGPVIFHQGHSINVNPDNGSVSRVNHSPDYDDADLVWVTGGFSRPVSVAMVSDEVWVLDQAAATIEVLSFSSGERVRTIALPRASSPRSIVVAPSGRVYVTLSATGEVLALEQDGTISARETVAPTAHGLTWFDDRLYVTRFISGDERGEVHVLDAQTLASIDVIELAFDQGPDTEAGGRGVPNYVAQVQISPDGLTGYVASKKDNIARGLFRDGEALTFESRVRTIVSAFDVASGAEDIARRMDINDRDMVQATLLSPLGDLIFVASQGVNTIDVFDTVTLERVSQFDTGRAPQGMALDTDGRLAVHNFLSRSVGYYDVSELISGRSNAVRSLGESGVVEPSSEALEQTVLLGKRIFYDASDTRMSRDGYISCASCHIDGGHDGRTWDFTQAGEGLRNTIDLRGRAGLGHGRVHWTANFDEIQDFENDIRNAFGGSGFLSDDDFSATEDPLGSPKAGLSGELDALAAYVQSLRTVPASPFREEDGTLSEAARRGREVFIGADCQRCHSGSSFTDLMRHDVGTATASSGLGIGQPLAGVGFDTPTLLGIWESAPYLHDGSASDLLGVLDRHAEIPSLAGPERDDLIAYLRALDSTSLAPEADCAEGPNECVGGPMMPQKDGGVADLGAMPTPDAGSAGDAGVAVDAGEQEPDPEDAQGCGCSATHHRSGPFWLFGLFGLLFGVRKRRH